MSTSTLSVLSPTGDAGRTVELPAEIFDVQVNIPLIHQVVVAQLAAARQGTPSTKPGAADRGWCAPPPTQKGPASAVIFLNP